jgi:hypothetical protein
VVRKNHTAAMDLQVISFSTHPPTFFFFFLVVLGLKIRASGFVGRYCTTKPCLQLFVVGLGFELSALLVKKQAIYHLCTPGVEFCSGYFGDGGVSQTICLGWP